MLAFRKKHSETSRPINPDAQIALKVWLYEKWLRGTDSNRRPSGYEPDELPNCSTPRRLQFLIT